MPLTPTPLPSGEGLEKPDFSLLLSFPAETLRARPQGEGGWESVACFPQGGRRTHVAIRIQNRKRVFSDTAMIFFNTVMAFHREAPELCYRVMALLYGLIALHREAPELYRRAMALLYDLMAFHREAPELYYKVMALFYDSMALYRKHWFLTTSGTMVVSRGCWRNRSKAVGALHSAILFRAGTGRETRMQRPVLVGVFAIAISQSTIMASLRTPPLKTLPPKQETPLPL